MDQEIKERWIAALRSGRFSQTNGVLNDSAGFCCLGVLCEIAEQDQVVIKRPSKIFPSHRSAYIGKFDPREEEETTVLPNQVIDWSGISGPNPNFQISRNDFPYYIPREDELPIGDDMYITSLATLNDENRFTFEQIADVIEKYF